MAGTVFQGESEGIARCLEPFFALLEPFLPRAGQGAIFRLRGKKGKERRLYSPIWAKVASIRRSLRRNPTRRKCASTGRAAGITPC